MRVTFWGVRGLVPCPGPETQRYGGNTSCVLVEAPNVSGGTERIILDAGTGIVGLGRAWDEASASGAAGDAPFGEALDQCPRATLLLSHMHWDHIQGFPFFPLVHVAGSRLQIYGPQGPEGMQAPSLASGTGAQARGGETSIEAVLERQMNPHYSPLETLRNVGAKLSFKTLKASSLGSGSDEPLLVGDVRITAHRVAHGQGSAFAYRLAMGDRSLVYAPDVDYGGKGPDAKTIQFFDKCDLLIHDATFGDLDGGPPVGVSRGYASAYEAVEAGLAAKCERLVLFHHHPDATDDALDERKAACERRIGKRPLAVYVAQEGLSLEV